MDSGCIFKGEPTGFADGADMGCEKKSRVEDDCSVFSLSNWKHGIAITWGRRKEDVLEGQVGLALWTA